MIETCSKIIGSKYWTLTILILGLSLFSIHAHADTWLKCANEGETCQFKGSTQVRYGAAGVYASGLYTNSVLCSNSVFGDPIFGTAKTCEYLVEISLPAPGGKWIRCADEGQFCSFSGNALVRYGSGTTFNTASFQDGVSCSNSVFGDPTPGIFKFCDYQAVQAPAPINWIACASEGQFCAFSGTATVWYGAGESFVTLPYANGVYCNNSVFGDPAPGVVKSCKYVMSSQAPLPSQPSQGLRSEQLGLIVNDNDPISVQTGAYYKLKRGIPEGNIVHVSISNGDVMDRNEFAAMKSVIDASLPPSVQAIAVAWTRPFRVECNSMTSAITRGFFADVCDNPGNIAYCGLTEASKYYNSNSAQPFTDLGLRPSMMLAGFSLDEVKALIDRGLSSDHTNPYGKAHIMNTVDSTRSLRAQIYNPANLANALSPFVTVDILNQDYISGTNDTLFYFQGITQVEHIADNYYPPGAIADNLTSFGGYLSNGPGSSQTNILEFLSAGATGSFGTATEPCAYASKFSDPAILIKHYTSGETLVEAYWKSLSQTFQGVFVGDPLANPWMH